MDPRQFRVFVAVAESGSFSEAARRLGTAQPSLSRHVKLMERELGVALFLRGVRGVTLTEAGQRLYYHAKDVVKQLNMTPLVVAGNGVIGGHVRVGLPHSASVVLARPLLKAAARQLPQVHVHLVESVSGYLREWVETSRLDLAILFDAKESPNLRLSPILIEDLCLVGPADADLVADGEVPFERLDGCPLILPGLTHAHRRLLEALALSKGLRLNIAFEIDSLAVTTSILQDGNVFAILAPGAVRSEVEAGRLKAARVVRPIVSRSVCLATSTIRTSTRACEALGKLTIDTARALVGNGTWPGTLADDSLNHRPSNSTPEEIRVRDEGKDLR